MKNRRNQASESKTDIKLPKKNPGIIRYNQPKADRPNGFMDYKAISLHGWVCGAWFQENEELLKYANSQPLAEKISCMGDGHPGIWNMMAGIRDVESRREVLDWYHLMENLYKVGGSEQSIKQVRKELWKGNILGARELFNDWDNPPKEVINFLDYLDDYKTRIPQLSIRSRDRTLHRLWRSRVNDQENK